MRTDNSRSSTGWRFVLHLLIAALGVMAIVGSGGGGFPDTDLSGPFPPAVTIEPARATVQVGATVAFSVITSGTRSLSYQWQRNGIDIAGATGTTYTLVGANLADDGVQIAVRVSNSVGVDTASSLLRVTTAPALTCQDSEFAVSDWAVAAVAEPSQNGPTHTESQVATGGDPGAFRSITVQMPQGPSSIRVFHTALSSTCDPSQQGAIYTIDFELDCNRLNSSTLSTTIASPMLEQGGRRFALREWGHACAPIWETTRATSLRADEFVPVAGPVCAANELCPDFSASGAPIRFGFISSVDLPAGAAAGAIANEMNAPHLRR